MSNRQSHIEIAPSVVSTHAIQADVNRTYKKEAVLYSVYFIFYVAYLFVYQENEFLHWLSLVIIPAILIYANQRRSGLSGRYWRNTLSSVGIRRSNFKNGILLAIVLGLAFGAFVLLLSDEKQEIWNQIGSGRILFAIPLAFFVMMLTAGFTEEFFFRGVLQTRMVRALNSRLLGVVAASIMFGIYHVPYAYLVSDWPSHGDFTAAIGTALSQAVPAGIVLGWLYEKSDNNLLACAVLHSLINTLPAAAMLKM